MRTRLEAAGYSKSSPWGHTGNSFASARTRKHDLCFQGSLFSDCRAKNAPGSLSNNLSCAHETRPQGGGSHVRAESSYCKLCPSLTTCLVAIKHRPTHTARAEETRHVLFRSGPVQFSRQCLPRPLHMHSVNIAKGPSSSQRAKIPTPAPPFPSDAER